MNLTTVNQRTEDRRQRSAIRYPSSVIRHQGFTLVELVVAVGIMAMVILFAGTIFKESIGSYRAASAQAEIMQKLRVITNQLDSDFKGLQKDGYLVLYSQVLNRSEYPGAPLGTFRAERVYFFCTGDFQSWFNPNVKSNIARVYFGHEGLSIADTSITVNKWRLAYDTQLLCPGLAAPPIDANTMSYAECKANINIVLADANLMLFTPPVVNFTGDPNTVRRLLCENAGQLIINWTDAATGIDGAILWYSEPYRAWIPTTPRNFWPRALKFTFTLYDSSGVFKDGQTFTHIVYLGD